MGCIIFSPISYSGSNLALAKHWDTRNIPKISWDICSILIHNWRLMTFPISPGGVISQHNIPDEVIEVFNQSILSNYSHRKSIFTQSYVLKKLADIGFDKVDVFRNGWLDIEDIYIN